MRKFTVITLFLVLFCAACSTTEHYVSTQSALNSTFDQIYQATLAHDAQTVYQLLSYDTHLQYTYEEFSDYFTNNYDTFLEYIIRTRDNMAIQPHTVKAQQINDPCGYLSMELQPSDQWKLEQIPEMRSTRSLDEYKQALVDKLKTEQFVQILNTYTTQHPEMSLQTVRLLRRGLLFLEKDHVTFIGQRAIVSFENDLNISLVCTNEGWSLAHIYKQSNKENKETDPNAGNSELII